MKKIKSPHLEVNEDWLNLKREQPLYPDLPIIDPHHHLWDVGFGKYYVEELLNDINTSGHNVKATVYIMSSSNTKIYSKEGPEEYKTLPEIEFATKEGKRSDLIPNNNIKVNASIVGSLDLTHGNKLKPVIEKGIEVSEGRLKGIRMLLASHKDPRITSGAVKSDLGLMLHPNFIEGAKCLQDAGLSLDFWIYHPSSLTALNALPQGDEFNLFKRRSVRIMKIQDNKPTHACAGEKSKFSNALSIKESRYFCNASENEIIP